ncbi:hypothetical protein RIF29_18149 [Crotalaria pallida]|uniref:Uncharacterized protein n=1 Tax=Crotalaria pallida TaxID=3830 RepID=A0AAN9IH45_CROPI
MPDIAFRREDNRCFMPNGTVLENLDNADATRKTLKYFLLKLGPSSIHGYDQSIRDENEHQRTCRTCENYGKIKSVSVLI